MKRGKKLFVLLGVLVVICIITLVVSQVEEKKEEIKNSDAVILELSTDSVESLSWSYNDASFAFHKDEGWLYDEDQAFPVDDTALEGLLAQFESFGASFVIEDVEDYGQYGLDDPTCTIQLTADGTDYEIDLGSYSTMDEERYVSIGDGNVYLVSHDPLEDFDVSLSDLIQNDTPLAATSATEVCFSGTEAYTFLYNEEGESNRAEDVYFTQEGMPLDTSRVTTYLSLLRSLDLTDYVTYDATEEELADYGLDTPALTVTVSYTDEEENEETFVLNLGQPASSQGDEDEEAQPGYLRVGDSQLIYEISADDYASLTDVSVDAFRHLEVLPADLDTVTEIDVTLEEENYTILVETDEDGNQTFTYNGEELDGTDLTAALEGLTADSFTQEEPEEKEEISLTLHLDGEGAAEVSVVLYRNDGTTCLAVVDGTPVSLVERSSVVDLVEAINAIVL